MTKRRVYEDDIEAAFCLLQKGLRGSAGDRRIGNFELINLLLEMRGYAHVMIDETDPVRPARQRLESECATTGEQVEAVRPRDLLLQPIK